MDTIELDQWGDVELCNMLHDLADNPRAVRIVYDGRPVLTITPAKAVESNERVGRLYSDHHRRWFEVRFRDSCSRCGGTATYVDEHPETHVIEETCSMCFELLGPALDGPVREPHLVTE